MKTIWKYAIDITDRQTILVPVGAKPLTTMMQDDQLCVWFEVDSTMFKTKYNIHVHRTGHNIDYSEGMTYIGSVINGPFVWHVYGE